MKYLVLTFILSLFGTAFGSTSSNDDTVKNVVEIDLLEQEEIIVKSTRM